MPIRMHINECKYQFAITAYYPAASDRVSLHRPHNPQYLHKFIIIGYPHFVFLEPCEPSLPRVGIFVFLEKRIR